MKCFYYRFLNQELFIFFFFFFHQSVLQIQTVPDRTSSLISWPKSASPARKPRPSSSPGLAWGFWGGFKPDGRSNPTSMLQVCFGLLFTCDAQTALAGSSLCRRASAVLLALPKYPNKTHFGSTYSKPRSVSPNLKLATIGQAWNVEWTGNWAFLLSLFFQPKSKMLNSL